MWCWSNVQPSSFSSLTIVTDSPPSRNICITFVQRRPNVFDVVLTLYKCHTNVLCLLGRCTEVTAPPLLRAGHTLIKCQTRIVIVTAPKSEKTGLGGGGGGALSRRWYLFRFRGFDDRPAGGKWHLRPIIDNTSRRPMPTVSRQLSAAATAHRTAPEFPARAPAREHGSSDSRRDRRIPGSRARE